MLPWAAAAQANGALELRAGLRTAHPRGGDRKLRPGGGRNDAGTLKHGQPVRLSNSNDAPERLRIQRDALLFPPAAPTGSDLRPVRCDTSGRGHDIRFRTWVAVQRHMGFGMDPHALTVEAQALGAVTA